MKKIKKSLALLLALMMLMTAMPLMAVPASASSWQNYTEDGKFYLYMNGLIILDEKTVITYYGVDGTIDDITFRPVAVNLSTGQFDTMTLTAGIGDYTGLFETSATSRGAHSYYVKGTLPNGYAGKLGEFKYAYKFDGTNYTEIDLCYLLSYKNGVLTFTFPEKSAVSALSSAAVDGSNVTANATVSGNTVSIPLDKALGNPIPVTLSLTADGSDYIESYEIYLNKDGTATDGYTTDGEEPETPSVDLSMLTTGKKIMFGTQEGNPVEWVIGGDGTTGMSVPTGCIALVSSGLVASDVEFAIRHSKSNVYANSNLESTVESAVTFSTDEQAAIQSRTLAGNQTNSDTCDGVAGDSVTDKVWAPTIKDAYALDNAGLSNVGSNYWLCSLGRRENAAAFVDEDGDVVWSGTSVDHGYGVRAALYLDLSKVYGTTAVEGKENTYTLNLTAPEEEPGVDLSKLSTGAKIQLGKYVNDVVLGSQTLASAGDAVEWVIGGDGTTGMPVPEGCIALISSDLVASPTCFHPSFHGENYYSTSNLRTVVESAVSFTDDEKTTIQSRTFKISPEFILGDPVTAEVWAPTIDDVFLIHESGFLFETSSDYWLSSPGTDFNKVELGHKDGSYDTTHPFDDYVDGTYGVRAALYIDLSKVTNVTLVKGTTDTYILNAPEEEPHTHAFSKDWSKDETAHWHECTAEGCDIEDYSECVLEAVAYGTHTYVDGVCSVCGFCTHPGFEGNTCTGCGVEFYRPYGVGYTDSAITFKINVLNDEKAEPFLAFGPCVRFDAFLIAGNSGSKIDLDLNFDKNGYYDFCIPVRDKDIFGINENDSGYCVKSGETYDVSIIAAKLASIKNFSAENPYVWLVLRPCFDNGSMDYGMPDATEFYVSAVCLGKFASLDDLHNLMLASPHTFDEEWSNDANAHWHACTEEECDIEDYSTCGIDEVAYGEHVGMEDDYTCDTCGYVNAEGQLANAKEDAVDAINELIESTDSDAVKALVEEAKKKIADAESAEEAENVVEEYTDKINYQKLAEDMTAEMNRILESVEYSDEAKAIASDALDEMKNTETYEELIELYVEAQDNIELQQLREEFISEFEAILEEDTYSDKIKDMVEGFIEEAKEIDNRAELEKFFGECDTKLAHQYFKDAASDEVLELAGENPSEEVMNIINDAIDEIQNTEETPDFDETYRDTFDNIINQAAKDVAAQRKAEAEALAEAITAAKADLNTAKNNAKSDEAKAALDEAIANVENAASQNAVTSAKTAGITAAANADKALADAKKNAKTEIENAVPDDAPAGVVETANGAVAGLEELTNLEAVSAAVDTAKAQIAEKYAQALSDAKDNAETEIENAVPDDAPAGVVETANGAIAGLEELDSITAVNNAVDTAKAQIAEKYAQALSDAKDNAETVLKEAKENAVSDEAKAAIDTAIENAGKAESITDVNAAESAGKAAAAEADKALADAKEEARKALETAKEEAVSDEAKAAVDEALEALDEATNLTDTAAAKNDGLDNAKKADEALAEAIDEAKEALEEAKENAIADDAKEALEEAIEDMDNATSLNAVADKKADAEEAAEAAEKELADAKEAAIAEVEEAAGTERSADLRKLVNEIENAINSATNPEAVQEPLQEELEEIEYQKTVDGFKMPDKYHLLGYKDEIQLSAEAKIGKIVYTSSDTSVATVDENGLVTAVGKGECVITATVEGTDISDECEIEVKYNFFDIIIHCILQIFSFIKNAFKSIFAF